MRFAPIFFFGFYCLPLGTARYGVALSVALGAQSEAIVVDDEQCAMACIQYLKEVALIRYHSSFFCGENDGFFVDLNCVCLR